MQRSLRSQTLRPREAPSAAVAQQHHGALLAERPDPSWQQQGSRLWAGRHQGRCIGTIEQGRAFTFVDTEGEPECRHRTLVSAQRSHGTPGTPCVEAIESPAGSRIALLVPAIAAALMTTLFVLTAIVVL